MSSIDDIRERFPDLGFAIYAMEPGAEVTLEVLLPDGLTLHTVRRRTVAEALASLFPSPAPAVKEEDVFA
jgi:hypothetical protein